MNSQNAPLSTVTELYRELKEMLYEEKASAKQRFLNYLVDGILFYVIYYLLILVLSFSGGLAGDDSDTFFVIVSNPLLNLLITYSLMVVFYTVFEGLTRGRTVGKMITGTRVVKTDGAEITMREAFLRSVSRLVPFEPFSAFGGNPWHDEWTGTKVIKVKR